MWLERQTVLQKYAEDVVFQTFYIFTGDLPPGLLLQQAQFGLPSDWGWGLDRAHFRQVPVQYNPKKCWGWDLDRAHLRQVQSSPTKGTCLQYYVQYLWFLLGTDELGIIGLQIRLDFLTLLYCNCPRFECFALYSTFFLNYKTDALKFKSFPKYVLPFFYIENICWLKI